VDQVSFGFKTAQQHTSFAAISELWREGEQIEAYEHAWLFDHFNPIPDPVGPCTEGWTTLAAMAARTSRLRLGLMVTGNTYRHPAVLAHTMATVDEISGGRLDFGFGAGWNVYEHESMGLPLFGPGERLRRWREACQLIKLLCADETVDFNGRYYQLTGARLDPKPVQRPHPPFVLGAKGERALRVVAEHADVWNFPSGELEEFRTLRSRLEAHCAELGRDPATITLSGQYWVDPADMSATRERVARFIEAGVRHVVLILVAPVERGLLTRLADEVIAPLR
jgi:alkanesulfonate monooxygenase SsuD/methylene tetrahydromethanopterin reductase-like flavin-dependent oxidoreductase (luciferase family)